MYIVEGQTIYACNICDEELDHMEELKECIVISNTDILSFATSKEANTNMVNESEEGLGHKCSAISEVCVTVDRINDMKYILR